MKRSVVALIVLCLSGACAGCASGPYGMAQGPHPAVAPPTYVDPIHNRQNCHKPQGGISCSD